MNIIRHLDIGVLKGKWWNPLTWLISWRSLSPYTHCVIFKNSLGDIFDPTIGGILDEHISKYSGHEIVLLRHVLVDQVYAGDHMQWLREKQRTCKGYDYLAWLGFATGIKELEDENRWFCSELPYWQWQDLPDKNFHITNEDLTFPYPSTLVNNPMLQITFKGKAGDLYR